MKQTLGAKSWLLLHSNPSGIQVSQIDLDKFPNNDVLSNHLGARSIPMHLPSSLNENFQIFSLKLGEYSDFGLFSRMLLLIQIMTTAGYPE